MGATLHLLSPDSRGQDPTCSCASIRTQGEGCSFLRTQDIQAGLCVGARSVGGAGGGETEHSLPSGHGCPRGRVRWKTKHTPRSRTAVKIIKQRYVRVKAGAAPLCRSHWADLARKELGLRTGAGRAKAHSPGAAPSPSPPHLPTPQASGHRGRSGSLVLRVPLGDSDAACPCPGPPAAEWGTAERTA